MGDSMLFLTGLAGSAPLGATQFESQARLVKSQFSGSARPKEWPALTARGPEPLVVFESPVSKLEKDRQLDWTATEKTGKFKD